MSILFAAGEIEFFETFGQVSATTSTEGSLTTRVDPDFNREGITFDGNSQLTSFVETPNFGPQTFGWLHVRGSLAGGGSFGDGEPFEFFDNAGNLVARYLRINSLDTFQLTFDNGASFVTLGTVVDELNGLQTIDIAWNIDASTGFWEIFSNNVSIFRFDGDTSGGVITDIARIRFSTGDSNTSGGRTNFTEFIVSTTPTLGMRVATLFPNGTGTRTDFSGVFADIDDLIIGDGVTQITSDTAGDRSSFQLSDLSATAATLNILAVGIGVIARNNGSGPTSLGLGFVSGGTEFIALSQPTTLGFQNFQQIFAINNPITGLPWTLAEVQSLELLVEAQT